VNRPIVVLDTEAASGHDAAPHLVELGAVRVVDGEVVDRFESLVRPMVPVDPGAAEVHGLEDADLSEAPPAAEVLADFLAWLGEDWMAAHDAPRDARILAFELTRAQLPLPGAPVLDTLRLARKLIPEAPDHRLETLCEYLGLEEGEHHRALADAVWAFKVLEACCAHVEPPATAERLLSAAGGVPTTVASYSPTVPRMKPRWRLLEGACGSGERLTLLYGSDEEPPVELPVVPHLLYSSQKKGYLEAECVRSGLIKTYRLDRIHRVLA
jgi:DNA polymerase III epsilon subunit family exonuclease